MRVVVCDAGPLIHLGEAGLHHLLVNCGDLLVPPAVHEEAAGHVNLGGLPLKIAPLDDEGLKRSTLFTKIEDIHAGEAQAIVLASREKADWLLTDDTSARLFASSIGVEVHGSLGVVLWNAAKGFISITEAKASLMKLRRSSLWLSKSIIKDADKALSRIALIRKRVKRL